MTKEIRALLNRKVEQYNQPGFIVSDPISVPRRFSKRQDIEIAGLFAALLAWGNRTTIINSTNRLLSLMDESPHAFCLDHSPCMLKKLIGFKHRTFNDTDLLYFIHFLQHNYKQHSSLETAFTKWMKKGDTTVENALTGFHEYFFSLPDFPARTKKHIASPARGSACKRLNMFLRWMVRKDGNAVDFGCWKKIQPSQLICPLDIHVSRTARKLGLLQRPQNDWLAAIELTANLRILDEEDPVKYDFALFGMGVMEKF